MMKVDIAWSFHGPPGRGRKVYQIALNMPGIGSVTLHEEIRTWRGALKIRTQYRKAFKSLSYDDLVGPMRGIAGLICERVK